MRRRWCEQQYGRWIFPLRAAAIQDEFGVVVEAFEGVIRKVHDGSPGASTSEGTGDTAGCRVGRERQAREPEFSEPVSHPTSSAAFTREFSPSSPEVIPVAHPTRGSRSSHSTPRSAKRLSGRPSPLLPFVNHG